jgi:5'-deoxynucleotidase YfbR-like HD superfamily hydrolase
MEGQIEKLKQELQEKNKIISKLEEELFQSELDHMNLMSDLRQTQNRLGESFNTNDDLESTCDNLRDQVREERDKLKQWEVWWNNNPGYNTHSYMAQKLEKTKEEKRWWQKECKRLQDGLNKIHTEWEAQKRRKLL